MQLSITKLILHFIDIYYTLVSALPWIIIIRTVAAIVIHHNTVIELAWAVVYILMVMC